MWSRVPHDSDLRMTALARTITASVDFENNIISRSSQGAFHQEELIGGKPPVLK
jgi:hypothetical protein